MSESTRHVTIAGSRRRYEALGLLQAESLGFVIPAGGLGERLGFSGVKFELPAESATHSTVLQTYAGYIRAVQAMASERAGRAVKLPLAIMTSDDTHAGICRLLERSGYYGLHRDQVTLLKQEKVGALSDAEGSLALSQHGYGVLTKPHGHGDVHFLMHSTGTALRWRSVRSAAAWWLALSCLIPPPAPGPISPCLPPWLRDETPPLPPPRPSAHLTVSTGPTRLATCARLALHVCPPLSLLPRRVSTGCCFCRTRPPCTWPVF